MSAVELRHVVHPPDRVLTLVDLRAAVAHHAFRLVDVVDAYTGKPNVTLVRVADAPEMEPGFVPDEESMSGQRPATIALMEARRGELLERTLRLESFLCGHCFLGARFVVQVAGGAGPYR